MVCGICVGVVASRMTRVKVESEGVVELGAQVTVY